MCHIRSFCHIWSVKTGCMTILSYCLAYEIACLLLVFIGEWYNIPLLIWNQLELSAILLSFLGIYENDKVLFRPYLILQLFDLIINLAVIFHTIFTGKMIVYSVTITSLSVFEDLEQKYICLGLLTCKTGFMWYSFLVIYNYYKGLGQDVNMGQSRTLLNV